MRPIRRPPPYHRGHHHHARHPPRPTDRLRPLPHPRHLKSSPPRARTRAAPRGIIPPQRRDTMRYAKLAFVLLGLAATLVAADPASGTWKLDAAKSKYTPGPPPKRATITYEETADEIKRTGESVDAEGKTISFSYTAKYDGKEYPVSGSDLYDTISLKRITDHTAEA